MNDERKRPKPVSPELRQAIEAITREIISVRPKSAQELTVLRKLKRLLKRLL